MKLCLCVNVLPMSLHLVLSCLHYSKFMTIKTIKKLTAGLAGWWSEATCLAD